MKLVLGIGAWMVTAILGVCSMALGVPTLTTLVNFNDVNGALPTGGLTIDALGNLYGTTTNGGQFGTGTVFKVAAGTHTLTTLASLQPPYGQGPLAGVVLDAAGNVYGRVIGNFDTATVFKIAAGTNVLSNVASLGDESAGEPYGGLLIDAAGNLYGTITGGGTHGAGAVFKIAAGTNTVTTLVNFNSTNGAIPYNENLIADAAGNLYGTTNAGGVHYDGTVFEIAAGTNVLSTLASFNFTNGYRPDAGLWADSDGNLYGTTVGGGANGDGTVFKIAAGTNMLTTLIDFDGANGMSPSCALIGDAEGNLYGTTELGGTTGQGTAFKLSADTGTLTTLVNFNNDIGDAVWAGLVADTVGNLYGVTKFGGSRGDGTVFEITDSGFAVPEPGAFGLAAVGSLALLRRRRRISKMTG